jgi:DNA mismatch repair protein MutS2
LKRKQLKLNQKEHELRVSANTTREVDKVIRQLKEEKNLEKAQEISAKLRQERSDKARQVDEVNAEVLNLEEKSMPSASSRPLAVGDFVRLRAGGATGRVEEIKGQKASVAMGGIRVTAHVRDLLPAAEPMQQTAHVTSTDLQHVATFDAKIDLRGMSKDEAMQVLEKFVDNALLSNASSLRILHGKGDGVLRKVVRQKLREYGGNISNIYHPEQDGGGEGVTIVELA